MSINKHVYCFEHALFLKFMLTDCFGVFDGSWGGAGHDVRVRAPRLRPAPRDLHRLQSRS